MYSHLLRIGHFCGATAPHLQYQWLIATLQRNEKVVTTAESVTTTLFFWTESVACQVPVQVKGQDYF